MDNNNEKLIDKSYVADSEHIKENSASKSNDEMINKLNQPVVHSPNSNLHKNPLPTTSGLSASNKKADNDIRNATNNSSFEANRRAQLNNIANNNGLVNGLNKAKLSNAKAQNNTVNSLESAKSKASVPKRKGMLANMLGLLSGENVAEKAKDKTSTFFGVSFKGTAVRVATIFGLIPTLVFSLLIFTALFVIYAKLDSLNIPAADVLDTSTETLEKKLDDSDLEDYEETGEKVVDNDDFLSFESFSIDNSIYSIKLSNAYVLANEEYIDTDKINGDEEFDINIISELYPSSSDYANVDYSAAFFYKLAKLNAYYTELCGKQILNIPLLIITLKQESDDMAAVFASNLGYIPKSELTSQRIDETFGKYYDYYYNWSDYEYFRYNSTHDMEILAQHMVSVKLGNKCTYSKDKYDEFLKEFIEKKYYLSSDAAEEYSDISKKSSNYFTKYNLTEDQLLQIASLCQQEQPGVSGAAAEASLMANKFETEGSIAKSKYKDNPADGLYYYIKNNTWWNSGALVMNRRNASPEIVDAVRDVLVYGKRTLPKYVNSHDCLSCNTKRKCPSGKDGDICIIKTDGVVHTQSTIINKRSFYVPHSTQVANVYDVNAFKTFYSFPNELSDPFSYKSTKLREQYGECHYDFNKKEFVDCFDMKEVFVGWLIKIAEDNQFGYSQTNRDSLIDFDSSSLVYYGLLNSGFTTTELGDGIFTTANEREVLKKLGFKEIEILDLNQLQIGDILWSEGHTEVYIGEGMTVGAHSASDGTIDDGLYGDQNGNEISIVNIVSGNYWQYAYRYEG